MPGAVLDGASIKNKADLHRVLAEQLGLPSYYGRNLDGLFDLLTVLDSSTEIRLLNYDVLKANLGEYAEAFLSTVRDAAASNRYLTLVVVPEADCSGGNEDSLASLPLPHAGGELEDFIRDHEPFVRACYRHWQKAHASAYPEGDLYSVALSGLHEAMEKYDSRQGSFAGFATLVIRRRLTDYHRQEQKHRLEVPVDPWLLETPPQEEHDRRTAGDLRRSLIARSDDALALEIEALAQILGEYGIGFEDLVEVSPKAEKTRRACAQAAAELSSSEVLLCEMRDSRQLPLAVITKKTGVPRKTLERHRKYIIAAAEILAGDFPGLAGYLKWQ